MHEVSWLGSHPLNISPCITYLSNRALYFLAEHPGDDRFAVTVDALDVGVISVIEAAVLHGVTEDVWIVVQRTL